MTPPHSGLVFGFVNQKAGTGNRSAGRLKASLHEITSPNELRSSRSSSVPTPFAMTVRSRSMTARADSFPTICGILVGKYSEKSPPFRGREHGPFAQRIHSPKSTISVHEREELADARPTKVAVVAVAVDPKSRDSVGGGSMTYDGRHRGSAKGTRFRGPMAGGAPICHTFLLPGVSGGHAVSFGGTP